MQGGLPAVHENSWLRGASPTSPCPQLSQCGGCRGGTVLLPPQPGAAAQPSLHCSVQLFLPPALSCLCQLFPRLGWGRGLRRERNPKSLLKLAGARRVPKLPDAILSPSAGTLWLLLQPPLGSSGAYPVSRAPALAPGQGGCPPSMGVEAPLYLVSTTDPRVAGSIVFIFCSTF